MHLGQESIYVRTRDEPVWEKVRKISKEKKVPQGVIVVTALKFFYERADVDEMF